MTLTGSAESVGHDALLFVFGDYYCLVESRLSYDRDAHIVEDDFSPNKFRDADVVSSGLMTQDDLDEERTRQDAMFTANRQAYDEHEYRRLYEKFGGETPPPAPAPRVVPTSPFSPDILEIVGGE
jgi:hypothetical protein